jgi:Protein of unknown function (DUF2434)
LVENKAKPAASDARFKVAAFSGVIAWCIIVHCLRHNLHYYKPKQHGPWQSFNGFLHYTPIKFMLVLPLMLVKLGYSIASSFEYTLNPMNINVNIGYMYGLGYAPILLILLILEIAGYFDGNEDKMLITQRRNRGRQIDNEIGIVKKPNWWSKMSHNDSMQENLRNMDAELAGRVSGRAVEMDNLAPTSTVRDRSRSGPRGPKKSGNEDNFMNSPSYINHAAKLLFPAGPSTPAADGAKDLREGRKAEPNVRTEQLRNQSKDSEASVSTLGSLAGQPQKIKSMLDI